VRKFAATATVAESAAEARAEATPSSAAARIAIERVLMSVF
jgi:hypothetical protein